MEDSRSEPLEDAFLWDSRWLREKALRWRWACLKTHSITRQVFVLLSQQPERQMYLAEIAATLGRSPSLIHENIRLLRLKGIIGEERRGSKLYIWLQPGMVEEYQQWLALPEKPLHLRVFELLERYGELSDVQIIRELGIPSVERLRPIISPLLEMAVITKRQKLGIPFWYYRVVPENAGKYRQWLES